MAFVYDGETLPAGKSDLAPSTVPVDKKITAAEYNALIAAVTDLRTAMLSGQYHGLNNTPTAGVSGAGAARLRAAGGRLQASEAAGIYRSVVSPDVVHVRDYGAVGDGTTDDAVAIQAAIADAQTRGVSVHFEGRTYAIGTELQITSKVELVGVTGGSAATKLRARTAGMRSIVFMTAQVVVKSIVFDGARLATSAVLLRNSSYSVFEDCHFSWATRDGVYLPPGTDPGAYFINDQNVWTRCFFAGNGTLRHSSDAAFGLAAYFGDFTSLGLTAPGAFTASVALGATTLTGAGTAFVDWGVRPGDPVLVGTGAGFEQFVVLNVDSQTQLTLDHAAATARTVTGLAIGIGDGYHEGRHADNNIATVTQGLMRLNAGFGAAFSGLYGPTLLGVQCDNWAFWGLRVGDIGVVYSTTVEKCYFEGHGQAIAVIFAANIRISNCLDAGTLAGTCTINPEECSGLYIGTEMEAFGSMLSRVPTVNVGRAASGASHTGPAVFQGSNVAIGASITLPSVFCNLYGEGAPPITAMTGTSTIAILRNWTLGTISFQSSSTLRLTAPTVTLLPDGVILFVQVGSGTWLEIGHSDAPSFADATGSPGAATQNTERGRVAIAIGASQVVVTNNRVTTTSVVTAVLQSEDTTLTQLLRVVCAAGSFTIVGNAAATAACNIGWVLEA